MPRYKHSTKKGDIMKDFVFGILIDGQKKTAEIVKVDTTHILESIYKHLECSMVQTVQIGDKYDALFVDEEGVLFPKDLGRFTYSGLNIHGKGLILGIDEGGNTISPQSTINSLLSGISFEKITQLGKE